MRLMLIRLSVNIWGQVCWFPLTARPDSSSSPPQMTLNTHDFPWLVSQSTLAPGVMLTARNGFSTGPMSKRKGITIRSICSRE